MEIGTTLCTIGLGRTLTFFDLLSMSIYLLPVPDNPQYFPVKHNSYFDQPLLHVASDLACSF